MKRQFSAILLIFSMAMPVALTFSYLHFQKKMLRKDIKHRIIEGLDRDELVKLSFTTVELDDLKWEHSREFEFNGEMYDIVLSETAGDTIHYWCWWDHEETKLNRQLHELISKSSANDNDQKNTRQRLSQFLQSLYITNLPANPTVEPKIKKPEAKYQFNLKTIDFAPPNPPPEIA